MSMPESSNRTLLEFLGEAAWVNGAVLSPLRTKSGLQWFDDTVSRQYYGRSGSKIMSPLLALSDEYSTSTVNMYAQVADIIYSRFGGKWVRLKEIMDLDYDPLQSYDYTETRTPNLVITGTSDDRSTSATNSRTGSTENVGSSSNQTNSVYAYNSDKAERQSSVSMTDNTDTRNESTNDTTGNSSANREYTESRTGSETITRNGNTWVNSRQKLLEEEIELRRFDFLEEVFNDIDKVLTCPMY